MKKNLFKRLLFFFFFAVIALSALFLSKSLAFASDVVINEFLVDPDSDQWVELYNKGDNPVDISGWFIDDSGGTEKFTIASGTVILSREFKVFESGYLNLNRSSADIVRLLNGVNVEDSYSYTTGPGVNKSYGRDKDGIGIWVGFDSLTKGFSNNDSVPMPTPTNTPTPTPSPSPTSSPKPTSTPKPSATAKPTATPRSTPTPTTKPVASSALKISSSPSRTISAGGSSNTNLTEETSPGKYVLAANTSSESSSLITSSKSGTPTPKKDVKVLSVNENPLSKILIGIGSVFILACGILAVRSYKKSKIDY